MYNSTGAFTAGQCVESLIDLMDIQGAEHTPLLRRSPLGYLEALTSQLNRQGVEEIPIQRGDKLTTSRIKYMNRAVESQVSETIDRSCSNGDFDDYNEVNFEITKEVEERWSLNEIEFRSICEGNQEFATKMMNSHLDNIARKINKRLLTEQAANMGVNKSTGLSTARTVTVFPAATGNPNPRPIQLINFDYKVSNQSKGTPIIVMSDLMYQYHTALQVGCCNDGGTDMGRLAAQLGYAPFLDVTINEVFDANEFVVLEPTMVKFVGYNEYVGQSVKMWEQEVHTTFVDPVTNIMYDLKIIYACDNESWTWILRKRYDIFFQPSDAWHPEDPLSSTNGTLLYLAATS